MQANGDRNLIDRLDKLPLDKQPFWYINWKIAEASINKPLTYPQRPSHFAEIPFGSSGNTLNVDAPGSDGKPDLGNRYGEEKNPLVEAGLHSPRNNMTAFGHFPSKQ